MTDGTPRPKSSIEQEEFWRSLAIAGAVLALAGFGFASVWVIVACETADRLTRVQISAPFGIFIGAAVTFCTVVWRGLISARQADTGLQQLDGLRRQIAATEENNIAQQLQKGAELLGDDSRVKVSAGIATLAAICTGAPSKFDKQARRLLLDMVIMKGHISHSDHNITQACSSLVQAFEVRPEPLVDYIHFEEDDERSMHDGDYSTDWEYVLGAREITYVGGSMSRQVVPPATLTRFKFVAVDFYGCIFPRLSAHSFERCRFHECSFERADALTLASQQFANCDFSGAVIRMNGPMPDLRTTNNWYRPNYEPKFDDNPGPLIDPMTVLCAMEPPDDQGDS